MYALCTIYGVENINVSQKGNKPQKLAPKGTNHERPRLLLRAHIYVLLPSGDLFPRRTLFKLVRNIYF